jgi:hypothetical protein
MENKQCLEEAVKRLDEKISALAVRIDEQMTLRAEYAVQLSKAESSRLDSIRAVDISAVAVANDRAVASAAVLASQVSSSAETLRTLVAATAATVAQQLSAVSTGINDRLASLEKSQYENQGKTGGSKDVWGWVIGGIMAVVAIGSFLLPHLR